MRTLPAASQKLILTDSISPLPLHKALVLLDHIEKQRDERYYRHERLALAKSTLSCRRPMYNSLEVRHPGGL